MRALTKKESIRFMKFMLYLKSVGLTGKINQKNDKHGFLFID